MTTDEPKKLLSENHVWRRSVFIGEVIVFGGIVFLWCLSGLFELLGFYDYREIYWYCVLFTYYLPLIFPWGLFQMIFFSGDAEKMLIFLFPMLVTFVLWWIFLGVVLGSVIYRVRMYLRRKKERER